MEYNQLHWYFPKEHLFCKVPHVRAIWKRKWGNKKNNNWELQFTQHLSQIITCFYDSTKWPNSKVLASAAHQHQWDHSLTLTFTTRSLQNAIEIPLLCLSIVQNKEDTWKFRHYLLTLSPQMILERRSNTVVRRSQGQLKREQMSFTSCTTQTPEAQWRCLLYGTKLLTDSLLVCLTAVLGGFYCNYSEPV